jgi:hypothetical protein
MRRLEIVPALALAGLAIAPAGADEITDQLDQARAFYEEGDIGGAIAELEFTIEALRGQIAAQLRETFPEPPPGWSVEAGDGSGGANPFLGGNVVSRTYRQDGGSGRIEAQLMTGGGFMQGLAAMMLNPQMLAAQPNARRIRIGRESGVVTYDPAQKSGQLVVDLGGRGSLMLDGSGLDEPEPLEALVKGWDIARVKALLGG